MEKIGEVIESSTTLYTAECYELYTLPALGSLVKTSDQLTEIYGIVCQAGTASIETGRKPVARGKDEVSEEAIYQTSPQLLKLLRSEFEVLVVGHFVDGKLFQYLPSRPARIHSFVYPCSQEEIKKFGRSFDFLGYLLNSPVQVPPEELIPAVLREMVRVQEDRTAFLVAAGKALTAILGKDYQRLKTVLGRIRG